MELKTKEMKEEFRCRHNINLERRCRKGILVLATISFSYILAYTYYVYQEVNWYNAQNYNYFELIGYALCGLLMLQIRKRIVKRDMFSEAVVSAVMALIFTIIVFVLNNVFRYLTYPEVPFAFYCLKDIQYSEEWGIVRYPLIYTAAFCIMIGQTFMMYHRAYEKARNIKEMCKHAIINFFIEVIPDEEKET